MVAYYVAIGSTQVQRLEVVEEVLACATLQKLVFPAKLVNPPLGYIHLASHQDFKLGVVSPVFRSDISLGFSLDCENGMEFSCSIDLESSVVPDLITLQFSSQHIEEGIIGYDNLKQLIAEIIPVFQADYALVTDKAMWQHQGGRVSWKGPGGVYFPLEVGWMNFFGPRLANFTGRKRFARLRTCAEKYELEEGVMFTLQKEPFIADDASQRKRAEKAFRELDLRGLAPRR